MAGCVNSDTTATYHLREEVKTMAGNQTAARRRAQEAYLQAKKTGASQKDLNSLFASFSAAQAVENKATGRSDVARR